MTGHVTSLGVMPAEEAREKQIRIDVSGGASEKCAEDDNDEEPAG
jgi:hypothetical protein